METSYKDFLAHYGVKGQKWGVRNYQNPDGTLIHPKGRKKAKAEKKTAESDTWKKEESKWLSDDELNRRNNRMQREQQYKQNIDNRHPTKKLAKSAAKAIFIGTAVSIATVAMRDNYSKVIKKGAELLKNRKMAKAMSQSMRHIVNSKSRWVL